MKNVIKKAKQVNRRSRAYCLTLDPRVDGDRQILEAIRSAMIIHNRACRHDSSLQPMRVDVKPRIGRNSEFKDLYATGADRGWSARQGSYLMKHAARVDVYLRAK